MSLFPVRNGHVKKKASPQAHEVTKKYTNQETALSHWQIRFIPWCQHYSTLGELYDSESAAL